MVEIFKTNIDDELVAEIVAAQLQKALGDVSVSFDLDDCDKILRISGNFDLENALTTIHALLNELGYTAQLLDDEPQDLAPQLPANLKIGINAFLGIY